MCTEALLVFFILQEIIKFNATVLYFKSNMRASPGGNDAALHVSFSYIYSYNWITTVTGPMLTNYEDLNILFIEYLNGLIYLVSVMGFYLVELHKTISPSPSLPSYGHIFLFLSLNKHSWIMFEWCTWTRVWKNILAPMFSWRHRQTFLVEKEFFNQQFN